MARYAYTIVFEADDDGEASECVSSIDLAEFNSVHSDELTREDGTKVA